MREGVTPDGSSEVPVPAGQEDKVVNRWQVQGGEVLNWPKENGQTWGGQRKGKAEGSQPDTWKCLLPKVEVIFRDMKQAE